MYDLIFPTKCHNCYSSAGFYATGTLTTQLKPIKPLNNMKKRLEGAALELLLRLTRPGLCEPEF